MIAEPDLDLIISDLLDRAYHEASSGKAGALIGAIILLRELEEKREGSP